MQNFANFLKVYIDNSGLSLRKAADLCGIDRTLLGRYANGKRTPSGKETVDKIADGLGMPDEDREMMYSLLKREKKSDRTLMADVYIDRLCNETFEFKMYNRILTDSVSELEDNKFISLKEWNDILKYVMYVTSGTDKIYMRIDPEYKNLFRRFDFGKERFSKMDVACIVQLHGDGYGDNLESIRYMYALYPILCDLKSCSVWYYNRNVSESDEAEINFVISDKGIVVFDKTLNNGFFTNRNTYMTYYQRVFDMLQDKCNLYVNTTRNCDEYDNPVNISYDKEENIVKFRRNGKNTICISETSLIHQFMDYIKKISNVHYDIEEDDTCHGFQNVLRK